MYIVYPWEEGREIKKGGIGRFEGKYRIVGQLLSTQLHRPQHYTTHTVHGTIFMYMYIVYLHESVGMHMYYTCIVYTP